MRRIRIQKGPRDLGSAEGRMEGVTWGEFFSDPPLREVTGVLSRVFSSEHVVATTRVKLTVKSFRDVNKKSSLLTVHLIC